MLAIKSYDDDNIYREKYASVEATSKNEEQEDCPHLIQNRDEGICLACGKDFN